MSAPVTMTPYTMNQLLLGIRTQLLLVPSPRCHLFQNNFVPSNLSVLADFTEATYDGYAAQTMLFAIGPYREVDGSFSINQSLTFPMTGSVTPNIIYGAYWTDNGNTQLQFANVFDVAVPMVDAFSILSLRCELTIPPNVMQGGAIVVT